MRIWIDCEYNGFRGALISMALIAENGREFYEVMRCDRPHPWVQHHVIPVLDKRPIPRERFPRQLHDWLAQFDAIHVIADWPEDIKHFCEALIVGPGQRIDTPPLTMEVRRDLDSVASALPHNALEDARAIRASHLAQEAAPC